MDRLKYDLGQQRRRETYDRAITTAHGTHINRPPTIHHQKVSIFPWSYFIIRSNFTFLFRPSLQNLRWTSIMRNTSVFPERGNLWTISTTARTALSLDTQIARMRSLQTGYSGKFFCDVFISWSWFSHSSAVIIWSTLWSVFTFSITFHLPIFAFFMLSFEELSNQPLISLHFRSILATPPNKMVLPCSNSIKISL
jgi:hypothetical protein